MGNRVERDPGLVGFGAARWLFGEGWGSAAGKYFLCSSEKEWTAKSRFQDFKERFHWDDPPHF